VFPTIALGRLLLAGNARRNDVPSKSPAQARLFAAVAHSPSFARKVGIPQSVGVEFNQADAGTGILSKKRRKPRAKRIKNVLGK
jgi:hypothetical protein